MEQLTLEQAAHNYYDSPHIHSLQTIDAFKAGAEWQKTQYDNLLFLIAKANHILFHTGYGDLATEIEKEIERLQD